MRIAGYLKSLFFVAVLMSSAVVSAQQMETEDSLEFELSSLKLDLENLHTEIDKLNLGIDKLKEAFDRMEKMTF